MGTLTIKKGGFGLKSEIVFRFTIGATNHHFLVQETCVITKIATNVKIKDQKVQLKNKGLFS